MFYDSPFQAKGEILWCAFSSSFFSSFFFPSSISTSWVSISKSIYSCLLSRIRSSGSIFCNLVVFSLYKLNRLSFFCEFLSFYY